MNTTRLALVFLFVALFALPEYAAADITTVACGGRNQRPCTIIDSGWWHGGLRIDGCDRGLDRRIEFGWPYIVRARCRLGTRFDAPASLTSDSFAVKALAEQRKLAQSEPLNWFTQLGTHNAYNALSDGYVVNPNQVFSLSEQLNMGSRVLYLDVHNLSTGNKLSHAMKFEKIGLETDHIGASVADRHMVMGLREIKEWLNSHPTEIVTLRFEDWLRNCDWGSCEEDVDAQAEFADALYGQLGPWLMRRADRESYGERWPTKLEMLANGWRVLAFGSGEVERDFILGGYSDMREAKRGTAEYTTTNDDGSDKIHPDQCPRAGNYEKFTGVEEDSLRFLFNGVAYDGGAKVGCICPGDGPCNKSITGDGLIESACEELVFVENIRDCNLSTVSVDRLGGPIWIPFTGLQPPNALSLELIWSWGDGLEGWTTNNRAAIFNDSDRRWSAADPTELHRFACGMRRDGPPETWPDFLEERGPATLWRITEEAGPWEAGDAACAALEPVTGINGDEYPWVFSVPVNALQNRDLAVEFSDIAAADPSLWLAYRDVDPTSGVNWQTGRGQVNRQIKSDPLMPTEGDLVRFSSSWSAPAILGDPLCVLAMTVGGEVDRWSFGDGSPLVSSEYVTPDLSATAKFEAVAKHRFEDNHRTVTVTHSLPPTCSRSKGESFLVRNAAPKIQLGCANWDGCEEEEINLSLSGVVGQPVALELAFHDPGVADTHVISVDWGDASTSDLVAQNIQQAADGLFASVSGTHEYFTCGLHAVEVSVEDDDGGVGRESLTVDVTDEAPTIACPADVLIEATRPDGAAAILGDPVVFGGECNGVSVSNDAMPVYPIGETVVLWRAADMEPVLDVQSNEAVIREATCQQAVMVVDTTAPDITAPADVTVTANQEGEDIGEAIATDAVGVRVVSKDAPAMFKPGKTVVTWYAMDAAGNLSSATQTITANESGGGVIRVIDLLLLTLALCLRQRRLRVAH